MKLYTKNQKEKANEKLKAQDVLKDLQVDNGKSTQPSVAGTKKHQPPTSQTSPTAKSYIFTSKSPTSPSSLAANIFTSLVTQTSIGKKLSEKEKKVHFKRKVQEIPKYTLVKS